MPDAPDADIGPGKGLGGLLMALTKGNSEGSKDGPSIKPKPDTIPVGMLKAFEDFSSTEMADSTRLKALEAIIRMVMDSD